MSDFSEYYKKAWELGLIKQTEEIEKLKAENARYREALLLISTPDPVVFDGMVAYSYKMIAREALRVDITPKKGDDK